MAVTLRKIAQTYATCHRAARRYDCALPTVLRRFWRLYGREKYSPNEICLWGLLDPALSDPDLADYVSNERLHELQAVFNPKAHDQMVEDKVAFHEIARTSDLAVPALYGVFRRDGEGRGQLSGQAAWESFLDALPHEDFVIKPSLGVYGRDVHVFQRSPRGLVDLAGQSWRPADIHGLMAGGSSYDTFVIQERLRNDPEIAALCAVETLQTLRLVTMIESPDQPRVEILFALWKISAADSGADNFNLGRSGNFCADVALDRGTLGRVRTGAPDGFGLVDVARHPNTGRTFSGLCLPHWDEARALVTRAALTFLPLRTIGWDVGLTPAGPVIVEGNAWWGPFHNAHGLMGRYLKYHRAGAA